MTVQMLGQPHELRNLADELEALYRAPGVPLPLYTGLLDAAIALDVAASHINLLVFERDSALAQLEYQTRAAR